MAQIYGLVCIVNNMVYVGCTKTGEKFLKKRLREHRCLLRAGKHNEAALQADWNRFGEHSFSMERLEELGNCDLETKRNAEKWHMDFFAAGNPPKLYNTNRVSFELSREAILKGVENAKFHPNRLKQTPESNEKRRLTQTGRTHDHGWKISATKKRLGQRPSLEAARKGALACHKVRYRKIDDIV